MLGYRARVGWWGRQPQPGTVLGCVTIIFVFRITLGAAIVPPWQNPDEPTHMAYVRMLASGGSASPDEGTQSEILRSMAEHGWWEAYGEPVPVSIPTAFNEGVPEHLNLSSGSISFPAYYWLAARYVRVIGAEGLMAQYYALRALSGLLAVLTLWCAWAASRLFLGDAVALGSTLILALHPQFALVALGVTPDTLVNLCGAMVWWQVARLIAGRPALVAAFAMIAATGIGFLAKRAFAPFIVVTPVMLGGHALRRFGQMRTQVRIQTRWLWTGAFVAVVALTAVSRSPEMVSLLSTVARPRTPRAEYFLPFTVGLVDSAWLSAGWLRFSASTTWYWIVRGVTLVAIAGIVRTLWGRDDSVRVAVRFAVTIVMIQVAAVYFDVYGRDVGPQGRYLFPAIGPAVALMWVGIQKLCPRAYWSLAGTGLIGLMVALDVSSWMSVIVPAYLR